MNKLPQHSPSTPDAENESSASETKLAKNLPDGRESPTTHAAEHDPDSATLVQLNVASDSITDQSAPVELVSWGLKQFSDRKIVLTTSFGMEGCALIDLCSKAIEKNKLPALTIAYIDTGFFFPETHQLREELIGRYKNLNFQKWETSVSVKQQAESYGEQLWKNNPNLCCHIRKVVPMKKNVVGYDIWMTGVRRSQTESRAQTPVLSWDWRYQILKFCPLASWTRPEVWQYVQKNDVPFNRLHLQNYPSISCFHCTKPVPGSTPDSDARQGRWKGDDKDECGLHFSI
jgi:phosphoadenosine phosphosulfate reductase